MIRLSKRGAIVMLASVVTLGVASVAWAAWSVTGSGTATARAQSVQALTATAEPVTQLYPGAVADVRLRVTNPNRFKVAVTSLALGQLTTDKPGCTADNSGILLKPQTRPVLVDAQARPQDVVLPGAIRMTNESAAACAGATFTLGFTFAGVSAAE
ncbi:MULTISPECIES: hypothetical protein [Polymorphospora]|uniref:Copper chaperone PCu(A)C n=1 Tax=Polymorphospora lycopeni TaxID=3140240 RepID=A0ABV5CJK6_9ACTN